MLRTCVICGKQFETNHSRQMTCSKVCSKKEHYLKNIEWTKKVHPSDSYRICKRCGKQFVPKGKEWFCSEKCRIETRRASEKASKQKILQRKYESGEIKKRLSLEEKQALKKPYICIYCGKKFTGRKRKYCSDDCRNKAAREYKKRYIKQYREKINPVRYGVCKICGKQFLVDKLHQIYCSKECRLIAGQKLRAEIFQRNHVINYSICPICGKQFQQTHDCKKYCSSDCREIAKQQTSKPKFVQKICIMCGKSFMTKSRSILCCSDECHRKYRVKVQTEYAHRKQEQKRQEKLKIRAQKERLLELKKEQKRNKKINAIEKKIKFPKYMQEQIIRYISNNQFDLVFQFIENRLAKKLKFIGEIDKNKVNSILSENSDGAIEELEEYLAQVVFTDIIK